MDVTLLQRAKEEARKRQPPPLPSAVAREQARQKLRSRIKPPPLPSQRAAEKRRLAVLDPATLDPFADLLLFARLVVEGWFAGKHRSLDYGSSAEFSEYRHYYPGDAVSRIDWKVYARNRDLVIRKNREEKDMTGYLLVDTSGSMAYRSGGRESKLARAVRTAAALAYLMQRQGDKSALTLFHTEIEAHVPPGSTQRHIYQMVTELERVAQKGEGRTAAHSALDLCAPLFKKKGSLVVISDFFTDRNRLFDALARFQHLRYHILLLHLVDPDEMRLPDLALARFVDLETRETIQVAPDEIRKAYRERAREDQARLEDECLRRGIEYRLLDTAEPWKNAIEAWLGLRNG